MILRTGLQRLKQLGFPENAIATFLALLGAITLLPYVAGRQFGPYTIPELLPPSTFWFLALMPPLVWALLVTPAFGEDHIQWRRLTKVLVVAVTAAVLLAVPTAPVRRVAILEGELQPGESKLLDVVLTSPQRIEAVLVNVEPSHELLINLCGPAEGENCKSEQHPQGRPYTRSFSPGRASVGVFNYAQNPPVTFTLEVLYVKQGLFSRESSSR